MGSKMLLHSLPEKKTHWKHVAGPGIAKIKLDYCQHMLMLLCDNSELKDGRKE